MDKEKVEAILLANVRWKRERVGPAPHTDLEVELAAELQLRLPEVGATARLRTIEGRLNGIANAMASCPGFAPIPQQLTYWREIVEQCYDLARDAGSPQPQPENP